MQGTLKDAIQYASLNPTSDFAVKLATQVKSGQFDTQAQSLGIDLSPIKQSSLGKDPVAPPPPQDNGLLGKAVDYVGSKLAHGEVDTAKALYERARNLVADTSKAGQADQGKPVIDQALGAVDYGAKKGIETIAGGVGDIFTNMISPFIPQKVKDAFGGATSQAVKEIKDAWNAPATTPEEQMGKDRVHALVGSLVNMANDPKNPQAQAIKTALSDALNISVLGAGGAAETPVKNIVSKGIDTLVEGVNATRNAAGELIANTAKQDAVAVGNKAFASSLEEAKSVLNPSGYFSPTEKSAALSKGNVTTKGKGIFMKEIVNPAMTRQTETISSLIDEGKAKIASGEATQADVLSPKNLPSQNIQVLNREARISDSNINDLVNRPELNKPFTQRTLDTVFDGVTSSAKKNLVFVPDTTEAKAYQQVIDVAKEEIAKQSYNNSGLRTGIKAFNARMEQILGKDIYSGASESVGNARLQAAKDVRSELNNFLADNLESPTIKKSMADTKVVNSMPSASEYATGKLQGGEKYRADLQREAQLLNAKDEIAYRASRTIDKTKLQQYLKDHPMVRRGAITLGSALVGGTILKDLGF